MRRPRSIAVAFLFLVLVLHAFAGKAQHYVPIGGVVDSVRVLPKLGGDSVYLVSHSLTVTDSGMLQVEAGVKMHFAQSAYLRVKGGNLLMNGRVDDTIYLRSYELSYDWLGIQVIDVEEGHEVSLSYVETVGALAAISASGSVGASIRHCTFNNYYRGCGIEMVDCSAFEVDSCFFSRCNSGIELKSKTKNCENNRFTHCIFDQGQINIEVSNAEYGFKCRDNIISSNCFQGAATAISFESVGGPSDQDATNYVLNNLISSELPQGGGGYSTFGIKAAMDTLVIRNNVFWSNDEAVRMMRACHLIVEGNTFYDNGLTVTNLFKSGLLSFRGNVISEANRTIVSFPSGLSRMNGNNFIHLGRGRTLFSNTSAEDVDMSGNYWDVDTTADIDAMIFDGHDMAGLGEIVYEKRLFECDTTVPVSPPINVKKQWVDGAWLVSWDDNPEADIDHYVLFYGNFNYYRFANHIDSICNTSIVVSSQQVENVAVMACDSAYAPHVYASPSQSAYAFAVYYPYAGEDAVLCAPTPGLEIGNASIPYTYNRFRWRTSGTGTFSDSLSLQPVYYPSPSDFDLGRVMLTLEVYSQGSWKTDAMELKLFGQLEVFAGEDYYSGLDRPIILNQAEANHFDSLAWHTLGDGRFEDSLLLNAVYHLGEQDVERRSVSLVIEAWSYCGYVSDTVRFDLIEEFTLEGRTWKGGAPRPQTQVMLVSMSNENPYVSGFYRTVSDQDGFFGFKSLMPDNYVLYAFPDTTDKKAGGSYYLGRLQWNESNMVLVDGNVYDVDIQLFELKSGFEGGQGTIGGWFDYPESGFKAGDFYCTPWFVGNEEPYCVEGLSNVAVALLDATKRQMLGFTLTNAQGRFTFHNLPFGTYYVMSDLPRYGRGTVERIVLTPENPEINDLHCFVNGEGRVDMRFQQGEQPNSRCMLYPNPAESTLAVGGLQRVEDYVITVTDVTGNVVVPSMKQRSDVLGEVEVPISDLSSGVYFVVVESASGREMLKFIKL